MKLKITDRCGGFTLIELMMSIVVLAILVGIGIPSFTTLINNNRVTSQVNDFVTSINLARSEAIKRGASLTVTAGGAGWSSGWTVAMGGTPLRQYDALKNDTTLSASDGVTTTLTFDSRGFLSNGSTVTFNLCNDESTFDRQVSVTAGGRVNTKSDHSCP